jgi:hypothetical protein
MLVLPTSLPLAHAENERRNAEARQHGQHGRSPQFNRISTPGSGAGFQTSLPDLLAPVFGTLLLRGALIIALLHPPSSCETLGRGRGI